MNATAHRLIASQGFSLSGTAATFNSTASTVTANSFTFVLPAETACSSFTSGYTAVVAAKQIIDIPATPNPLAPGGPYRDVDLPGLVHHRIPHGIMHLRRCANSSTDDMPSESIRLDHSSGTGCAMGGYDGGIAKSSHLSCLHPAATVSTGAVTQYNAMQAGFAGYLLAGGYFWNGTAWAKN